MGVSIKDSRSIDISHNGGVDPTPTPTPTPSPSPTPGCIDTESAYNCGYWKDSGYCGSSSQYYEYMRENCCHTCGFGEERSGSTTVSPMTTVALLKCNCHEESGNWNVGAFLVGAALATAPLGEALV